MTASSFKEYISHRIIGSPLEPVALSLRRAHSQWKQFRNPALKDIYHEPAYMKQVMNHLLHDSMNCIDIGCHLGSMLSHIRSLAPNGQHIGVEPVPYKAQWLVRKFPNVEILQLAVAEQEGETEFFITTKRSAYSGLRLHGASSSSEQYDWIKVRCRRLDDIVPPDRQIGFIKLDAEGAELNVLRGGESVLTRCRPAIIFYCTASALIPFQIGPRSVFEMYERHNYSVFTLRKWLDGEEKLTCDSFVAATQYPFKAFRFLALPNR